MSYSNEQLVQMCDITDASEKTRTLVMLRSQGHTMDAIAEQLGVTTRNLYKRLSALQIAADLKGFSPIEDNEGRAGAAHVVKGKSNYYDYESGQLKRGWVKTDLDKTMQMQAIVSAIEGICDGIKPIKAIRAPKSAVADLANMYHFTDYHMAMYAWSAETGDDWDTTIARQVFANALGEMMDGSPDAELGIFSNGGDFCHWDGWDQVTPQSKHLLDADTRFPLLAEIALECHIHAIEELLKKHKRVHAVIQEGNHDMASSVWLRKAMKIYFAKNKRVTIDDTEVPFYAMLWGKQMIAWHHGHKVKGASLPGLFSSDPMYREMWGEAEYCYIHKGHYHHKESIIKENGGAIVEQHPTLSGRDAYAARGGFVSQRAANCITYDKNRGEVSRKTVIPVHV